MVGLWLLVPAIGVRVPVRQHESYKRLCALFLVLAEESKAFDRDSNGGAMFTSEPRPAFL